MQINVNGKTYDTWEDVPEDVRKQLATLPDADHNGVPDVVEGNLAGLGSVASGGPTTFTSISVDGQQVSSLGELPPELQEMLRNALGINQPGSVAAPPPAMAGTTPVLPSADQVLLNGVPTTPGAEPARKPWWKRIFGG